MNDQSPVSVGLNGDGDEVAAIQDVERVFDVHLDYADAPKWFTAGDLFASLERALSKKGALEPDTWHHFAVCLASHTGVDAVLIRPESPLLLNDSVWARMADASAYVWLFVALILVGATASALL